MSVSLSYRKRIGYLHVNSLYLIKRSLVFYLGITMKKKICLFALGLVCTAPSWSFNCYLTLAKDNCWQKYNVTVQVVDTATGKEVTHLTVPAGKAWERQEFTCDKAEKLMYYAQFTPVIWESEKGKIYSAKTYLSLPAEIKSGAKAWNIPVCYSADFAQVPMPPEATNSCQCDFSSIPDIPPE